MLPHSLTSHPDAVFADTCHAICYRLHATHDATIASYYKKHAIRRYGFHGTR
jgi:acetate kinase